MTRQRQYCIEPSDEFPITMRRCTPMDWDCDAKPEVFCLCGCERQLCRQCARLEDHARQVRLAQRMIRHSPDRERVIARRIRSGDVPRNPTLPIRA